MARYMRIGSASFGGTPLPLPVSLRLSRRVEPQPAVGDSHTFAASVETAAPMLTADLRLRDTASAEALTPGEKADLSFTIRSTEAGRPSRNVTLTGAVLVGVELNYEQTDPASATLRFVAESDDGLTDCFSAGDAS
ncbi:MAG: hypothetical protein ACP5HU_10980 [Phycisphaerae bacterium]